MSVSKNEKKIGQILIDFGLINPEYLEKILKKQMTSEELVGQLMIDDGIINHDDLAKALSLQFNMPFFDVESYPPAISLLQEIPVDLLIKYNFIPVKKLSDKTIVLISDPNNSELLSAVSSFYDTNVEFFVGNRSKIAAIRKEFLKKEGKSLDDDQEVGGETMTFINKFLDAGHVDIVQEEKPDLDLSDSFDKVDMGKLMPDPGPSIPKPPPTPNDVPDPEATTTSPIKIFLNELATSGRHFLISTADGEKFVGRVIDFDGNFLLLDTSTGKKLFNFQHIGYIEDKNIKGGGE